MGTPPAPAMDSGQSVAVLSTVAGTGVAGTGGDNGPAASAELNSPRGIAVDGTGALYIADHANHLLRKVSADGSITTFAGTGARGSAGDGGPAVAAQLNGPRSVAVDGAGGLYIAEYVGHRVRRVAPDGTISTFAGSRARGFDGDGGPASAALLHIPFGLAADGGGALYIADSSNHRVRKATSAAPPHEAPAPPEGLPVSGTVVFWANVRSKLRMAVKSESSKDGAEVHQARAAARDSQRWRLVVVGKDGADLWYRIENVRSGKVLEVAGTQESAGAVTTQRAYVGDDAHHQQWKLIPVGPAAGTPRTYEIVNRHSGLRLRAGSNAPGALKQHEADGDQRYRQWQLLPLIVPHTV